jgi:hypothetical protein
MPGAYPKVDHLKGASLGQALALPTNIILGWALERLAKDKHSRDLYHKSYYGRNLQFP